MKLAFLCGAAVALAACQSPTANRALSEVTADSAGLPSAWLIEVEANTLPSDWADLFDDTQLRDYLAIAEANNLDLKQAEARLRQSEANLKQSRALLGPTVSADLSATGLSELTDFDQTRDSASANASGTWDLDIFGVNRTTIRQAEAQLDVQRANTARLRRAIQAQTARSYFQIIEADQQLGLAQENLTFLDETRRVSEARFEAGDIARSDLALAELEYENAVAGLRNQEFAARSARRALSIILGDFGAEDLDVSEQLPNAAKLGLATLPAELLVTRYDVRAARAAVTVELESFEATRKANWPSLDLSGRIGSSGAELSNIFDPDFYIASLTARLSAVLFDSGRNAAQVEAAEARIDASLAAYSAALRNAVFDVNDAFDQSSTLRQALSALERGRASAEEALALEQIKFDLGETILLDVLTVQRRVNAIRGARISTERRLLDAQIDAYLALGGTG
jgi:NodT family efflux transporter outer membrane factor (OMF) lipoprotein